MTKDEIHTAYYIALSQHKKLGQRLGQAFYNNLSDEMCSLIVGTKYDCFYNDSRISDCINYLLNKAK